jgi:hypothetical protein
MRRRVRQEVRAKADRWSKPISDLGRRKGRGTGGERDSGGCVELGQSRVVRCGPGCGVSVG